jgi:hypothetical protein
MIRTVDLNVRREKSGLEFHCYKNHQVRCFQVTRTDRPRNFQWNFKTKADALEFARRNAGETGALWVEVDAYDCAERVTRLEPRPATVQTNVKDARRRNRQSVQASVKKGLPPACGSARKSIQ